MIRLVLDSNILFTYFWKKAAIHRILERQVIAFAPEYALTEIEKYEKEISEKTRITPPEFADKRKALLGRVSFIPKKEYTSQTQQIQDLLKEMQEAEKKELGYDIDFLALALKFHCPLWSNDSLLKKQEAVRVYSTGQVIELLGE
jgi:predicted nucleic acid-binding protein